MRNRARRWVCGVMLGLLPAALPSSARAEPVALELLLAVDASMSVSYSEFELQNKGLALAFRSPRVVRAIRAVGQQGIAVAMIHWGGNHQQALAIDWTVIRGVKGSHAFGARIAETPRTFVGKATAISDALAFSIPLFDGNGFEGRRRVIDISGDGRNNQGSIPHRIRDQAIGAGVTINGLAILNEVPFLDIYYHYNVVGGTDAFVEVAFDYDDFEEAMVRKLVREITGAPLSSSEPPGRDGIAVARAEP